MSATGQLEPDILERLIAQVVEAVAPDQIILFGSAARGEMRPESDIDILVVKADADHYEVAADVYRRLWRIGRPVDVLVARPEDLARYGDCQALVYYDVLREGRVVYAPAAIHV